HTRPRLANIAHFHSKRYLTLLGRSHNCTFLHRFCSLTTGRNELRPIGINLRMAGVSRRGEGGGEWTGGPLWSPAVAPCLAWTSQRHPHLRAATRAPTLPNSSPAPTRDPSPDHFLFFASP